MRYKKWIVNYCKSSTFELIKFMLMFHNAYVLECKQCSGGLNLGTPYCDNIIALWLAA